MKNSYVTLQLATILASFIGTSVAQGFHQLQFSRSLKPNPSVLRNITGKTGEEIKSQKSAFDVFLQNEKYWYSVDVEVGNPPQKVTVNLDTGSSDLWVVGSENTNCNDKCQSLGTFDQSKSTSINKINDNFRIEYGDGSVSTGDWVTDSVTLGGQTVNGLTFAVGTNSDNSMGVLGIGFASLGGEGLGYDYTNYPKALVNAGIIESQTYSIYLDSADKGTILFGGVDHSKYTGSLVTVPITSDTRTTVELTGLKISDGSFSSESKFDVLLDTGSTLSYLPADVIANIAASLGATYNQHQSQYILPCDSSRNVEFSFGCSTISVPLNSFQKKSKSVDSNGNQLCTLKLIPTSGPVSILGDSFLRSAYVVFDLDKSQASIAQSASYVDSDDSQIEIIPSSGSVPGSKTC